MAGKGGEGDRKLAKEENKVEEVGKVKVTHGVTLEIFVL